MSDAGLVRRAQHGNRRAFLTLLRRHDGRARHLAYALLLDRRRMDQVMRTAYLKAWREIVRVEPKVEVGNWLYRTVYNACIDDLRLERVAGAAGRMVHAASAEGVPADDQSQPMVAVLRSLSPEQRVAVVMVDHEGFSPDAAARIQELPPSVLNRRLAAGRAALAELVHPVDPTPAPRMVSSGEADATVPPETDADATTPPSNGNGAASRGTSVL